MWVSARVSLSSAHSILKLMDALIPKTWIANLLLGRKAIGLGRCSLRLELWHRECKMSSLFYSFSVPQQEPGNRSPQYKLAREKGRSRV